MVGLRRNKNLVDNKPSNRRISNIF
jgi:hypothetical protein